ncbi:septal ring lytic transglycosylase RlpA family protein [Roseomonas sp. SSH11]|uniref:Endolytic peptidoglycan transglycosylase RlpA n=1 Tax=Pararoseomonas baculiformis TaxID=2820812 RepID=A0ABS4ABJ9_9PROT|nr:septal ring lytic transglycosylase RlpA family protein [Pararoseomonas baculiformis]MBP0443920.1 septal ring lytic transglycosylase RlpA family protein [Pararoseomonas baculiformis]
MLVLSATLVAGCMGVAPALAKAASTTRGKAEHARPHPAAQHGHASIYARSLAGRRMADGTRFDPRAATVASRTLPLGSRARVTNLRNGRSVTVKVTDRGPHIRQRILDVSPAVASSLGMGGSGTALVSVIPVSMIAVTGRAEAAAPPARRGRSRR